MSKGKGERGGPQGMMGRLQKMQEQLLRAQAELAKETVEATAGGGVVRVVMSGAQECQSVVIAPRLLEEGDVELIQDLVQLAVNQALKESQALVAKRLGPLSGGLGGLGMGR